MHKKPKHVLPHYTTKKKSLVATTPVVPTYVRPKPLWMRHDFSHHKPHYTIRKSAVIEPPLVMVPPHRKRRHWEMKRRHRKPAYSTIKFHPWKPAPGNVSFLAREVLSSAITGGGGSGNKTSINRLVREVLHNITPPMGVSYLAREVLAAIDAVAQVSTTVREVLGRRVAIATVTKVSREVLETAQGTMTATRVVREVLRSTKPFPNPGSNVGCRRHASHT